MLNFHKRLQRSNGRIQPSLQNDGNPDFRVDYGTIVISLGKSCIRQPLVVISSNRSRHYYSVEVMQEMMISLGKATKSAIEKSGKKAVILLQIP